MAIKKDKIKDLHYVVHGVLSVADIQAESDKILMEHGKTAKIAGFRPGHIPLDVLRQKYGSSVMHETINNMMNADMDAYATEHKIRLAGSPDAKVEKMEEGKDVEYTLEFDILPPLPKIELEKITLTKKVADIDEEEVQRGLINLAKSRRVSEKIEEDISAEIGHVADIDFKGFLGDTPFEGGEAKHHMLELGSNSFIPGFEEAIVGKKRGKFDINVTFPSDYHSKELAGKQVKFEIVLHGLRKNVIPEINDALAKEVGQESLDALMEHIRKILAEQYKLASIRDMKEELLETLSDKVKMDVPETLVSQEVEMAKHQSEHDGEKFDEKSAKKEAERRVKLGLILAEWGNQNKIEVTQDEIQQAIFQEAMKYPGQHEAVFDYYSKNRQAVSMLRGILYEQKVLDKMLELVKTKEKKVEATELFKSHDAK